MDPDQIQQFVTRNEWRHSREADAENFAEIKTALRDIRSEVTSFKERKMDWAPVGIMVSLSTFVLAAFGSVIAWGLGASLDKADGRVTHLESLYVDTATTRFRDTDAAQLEDAIQEDIRRVAEGSSQLGERINHLEIEFSAVRERLQMQNTPTLTE